MNPQNVALLWAEYKTTPTQEARERLAIHYLPLVKLVANNISHGLPKNIEQDDLESYGIFGLLQAIDRFEPEQNYKFETYAKPRIKGAIFDELRDIDWIPRSVRDKDRNIKNGEPITRQLLISLDEINPDNTAAILTGDPTAQYDIDETNQTLTHEINQMADRDRTILDLYYNKEQTLKQIGTTLDVTESCISQAHTKAIHQLRKRLARTTETT